MPGSRHNVSSEHRHDWKLAAYRGGDGLRRLAGSYGSQSPAQLEPRVARVLRVQQGDVVRPRRERQGARRVAGDAVRACVTGDDTRSYCEELVVERYKSCVCLATSRRIRSFDGRCPCLDS